MIVYRENAPQLEKTIPTTVKKVNSL